LPPVNRRSATTRRGLQEVNCLGQVRGGPTNWDACASMAGWAHTRFPQRVIVVREARASLPYIMLLVGSLVQRLYLLLFAVEGARVVGVVIS